MTLGTPCTWSETTHLPGQLRVHVSLDTALDGESICDTPFPGILLVKLVTICLADAWGMTGTMALNFFSSAQTLVHQMSWLIAIIALLALLRLEIGYS